MTLTCTRSATFCAWGIHAAALFASAAVQALPGAGAADWDRPPPRAGDSSLPPAARGFQAAVRSGAQMPWGDASDRQGDDLSARYGWQVPLLIDAGFKVQKPWFVGLYAGIGLGTLGSGNVAEQACSDEGVSCSTLSYQFGAQAQYHLAASDRFNPWIGVGGGYEIFRQSLSYQGYSETQQTSGIALLKLALGLDYRAAFGFGPFAEVSVGRFQGTRTEVGGTEAHEGPVEPGAFHGFFTIGARFVVMP